MHVNRQDLHAGKQQVKATTALYNHCFREYTMQMEQEMIRSEISAWENILRDEAVVNGFEQNGYLGVTYGKEDQTPRKTSPL